MSIASTGVLVLLGAIVALYGVLICVTGSDSLLHWFLGGGFMLLGSWVITYPLFRLWRRYREEDDL